MPYMEHPVFAMPDAGNTRIWRYMSLSKFLSVLETSSLFFASGKVMADIEWFEGRSTALDRTLASCSWEDAPAGYRAHFEKHGSKIFELHQTMERRRHDDYSWEWGARTTYVNSWHVNHVESHAMWRVYITGNEGICIQSDIERLKGCFSETKEHIYIGSIRYIDDETALTPGGNGFYPFMQKRKFFEYENELRAVFGYMGDYKFLDSNNHNAQPISEFVDGDVVLKGSTGSAIFRAWKSGLQINVDLGRLVEKIVIHPESPGWFQPMVQSIVEKLGWKFVVCPSAIRGVGV